MMVPCNPVRIDEDGLHTIESALRSGVIAQGPNIDGLEASFREMTGVDHAVAVANGTLALVLAGMAIGTSAGDTVLVSGFSFEATANAFLALGCSVVPVDVSPLTYNLAEEPLHRVIHEHPEASVLVIVDLFGNTASTDSAIAMAREHGLLVVEDAAQAVGAYTAAGEPIGARADATTFSLYATKNVFAGEGGIVATPRADVAQHVRALANHRSIQLGDRRLFGLNYRMNEMGAALAATQMPKLSAYVCRRRRHAHANWLKRVAARGQVPSWFRQRRPAPATTASLSTSFISSPFEHQIPKQERFCRTGFVDMASKLDVIIHMRCRLSPGYQTQVPQSRNSSLWSASVCQLLTT